METDDNHLINRDHDDVRNRTNYSNKNKIQQFLIFLCSNLNSNSNNKNILLNLFLKRLTCIQS